MLSVLRPGPRRPLRVPARVFARGYAQDYRIKRVLKLPHSLMLQVAGDVSRYHEFVPYCRESTVLERAADGSPTRASLRIGWGQLDEKFVSNLSYGDGRVLATAGDNAMFKELTCEWTVRPVGSEQCMAALNLRFQFQNKLYDYAAQSAGALVSKKMIEAFSKRAMDLYKRGE